MSRTNTFLLSESAKALKWHDWCKMGGCGLSDYSAASVAGALGCMPIIKYGFQKLVLKPADDLTLGQIQGACIVAGREIARFAKDHLGKPEMAVAEYVDGELQTPSTR